MAENMVSDVFECHAGVQVNGSDTGAASANARKLVAGEHIDDARERGLCGAWQRRIERVVGALG